MEREDGQALLYIDNHLVQDGLAHRRSKSCASAAWRPAPAPDFRDAGSLRSNRQPRSWHHLRSRRSALWRKHSPKKRRAPASRISASTMRVRASCRVIGPGAGPELAGHGHRLRRQSHLHAWRDGRARLRHRRHRKSRMCLATQIAVAAQAQHHADYGGWRACTPAFPPRTWSSASSAGSARPEATGHVIEYAGTTIAGLSMEGRADASATCRSRRGARAGMIAPDDTTFQYLEGRPYRAERQDWDSALARWRTPAVRSTAPASTARSSLDARDIAPMVSWGTSPEDVLPDRRSGARSRNAGERRSPRGGACAALDLYGPDARHEARPIVHDRPRLHRLLHQQAHRGSAPAPPRVTQGPQGGRGRRSAGWCPDRASSSARRKRRGWTACSAAAGIRVARMPAARCAWAQMAIW